MKKNLSEVRAVIKRVVELKYGVDTDTARAVFRPVAFKSQSRDGDTRGGEARPLTGFFIRAGARIGTGRRAVPVVCGRAHGSGARPVDATRRRHRGGLAVNSVGNRALARWRTV